MKFAIFTLALALSLSATTPAAAQSLSTPTQNSGSTLNCESMRVSTNVKIQSVYRYFVSIGYCK